MIERGRAVLRRREALGVSREQVSADTRIPLEHVAALEEGRLDALPAGPYADAWLRTLEAHLGIDSPPREEPAPVALPPSGGIPLWGVRVVAGVAMGALVAAIAWQALGRSGQSVEVEPVATEPIDQELVVRALRNTKVTVMADGELVREGPMAGGDELTVKAIERIDLEVEAAGALKLTYNGNAIVPQGRQEGTRRLVFVDDGGSR